MRIREIAEGIDRYPLPSGFGDNFVEYLVKYKVGNQETAQEDYWDWERLLSTLHSKGGEIYRAVFVKKGDQPFEPLGRYWSMRPLSEHALWRLWSDVCYSNQIDRYKDSSHEMALIHARTPPRNVTIKGVNLPEEYEEYEVNLLNPNAIEVINITLHPIPTET